MVASKALHESKNHGNLNRRTLSIVIELRLWRLQRRIILGIRGRLYAMNQNRIKIVTFVEQNHFPMDKALQSRLLSYLLPYVPLRISVFGSYARGEQSQESDLDILIQFRDRMSLLTLVQIEQGLSDELGMPIDLVTENSIKNPRLKEYIYKDLITIYE